MAVFLGLNEYNIAPTSAKKIGVFKNNQLVGYVPLGNLNKNRGQLLYKVGLLSDVHQDVTADTTESYADLQHALAYYNSKGVDFCICCGDILEEYAVGQTTNRTNEWKQYSEVVSAQNLKVYAVTGNHDVAQNMFVEATWKKYVNAKSQVKYDDVNYVSGGTNSSFEITKGNDHYLFLSMQKWTPGADSYNGLNQAYSDAELTWLESKLEEYRNERTFVVTHLFFPDMAGAFNKGNAIYGASNTMVEPIISRLKALLNKYSNSIWFSGHSHWKWYLQDVNKTDNTYKGRYCNVCKATSGALTIHLPSCAKPIDYNDADGGTRDKDTSCSGLASEGGIMYVYENAIEIQGISFKTNNHGATGNTSYDDTLLPIANYLLDTTLVNVPSSGGEEPEEPEPEEPTKTLESISVTWSSTSADVGTNPSALITKVEAAYSDGTKQTVTGYSVSPTALVEGSQTVTVTYQGKTSTKSIVGNVIDTGVIVLTSDEQTNWVDITSRILGGSDKDYNIDSSNTQQPYQKFGVYGYFGDEEKSKYSLKPNVDINIQALNALVTYKRISDNISMGNAYNLVQIITSSSFSLTDLDVSDLGISSAVGHKVRVIIKGMQFINGDNVDNLTASGAYYYGTGENNAYADGVKPIARANTDEFYIDFTRERQKLLWIPPHLDYNNQNATTPMGQVRFKDVRVLLKK